MSALIGFSLTPSQGSGQACTNAVADAVINELISHRCNCLRPAYSGLVGSYPNGIPGGRIWSQANVQYFIDHWAVPYNGKIILDAEHIYVYSQGHTPDEWSQVFFNNLDKACAEEYSRILPFNGNRYVDLCLVNEYDITNPGQPNDFYSVTKYMANYMRSRGITNTIGCNLPSKHSDIVKYSAELAWQGYHFYFNSGSASGAMSWINSTLAKGVTILNTEQGASSAEPPYTQSQINALNSYLAQCYPLGAGNLVWLNYWNSRKNLNEYENTSKFNPILRMPEATTPTEYLLTILSNPNATLTPSPGSYLYSSGSPVLITCTPLNGQRFVRFLVNGAQYTANPLTVTMNSDVTVSAVVEPVVTYHTLQITSSPSGIPFTLTRV